MSILVTGGAGFIGSHFIEHLLAHTAHRVVCLDNFSDYYDPAIKRANVAGLFGHDRVVLVRGDFCDQAELTELLGVYEVDRIVHLGGYPGVRYSVEHPDVYQQVNAIGTLRVLEAARKTKVKRVVVVSSSTVYGRGATAPFAEDAPLGIPLSPYGASKRAAELLALTYHELHRLPVVCVRLFSVYGPRLRPDLAMSLFAGRILHGAPIILYGDGTIRRDFTHVSDICRGLTAALHVPKIEGEVFNLGHDQPVTMRQVIATLESALGRRAIIHQQPGRREDMPLTHADLSKSRLVLGYEPLVPFAQGCDEYCAWFARTHRVAARVAA